MYSRLSVWSGWGRYWPDLRFGTRTLFVGFTVICIAVGWGSLKWYRNFRHEQALAAIEKVGGQVVKKDGIVGRVYLANPEIDDKAFGELIPHLRFVRGMRELDLVKLPITDRSVEWFFGFPDLEELYLFETGISDDGVERITAAMPHVAVKLEQPDPIASKLAATNIYRHAIIALAADRSGRRIVTGSGDGTLRWWSLPELAKPKETAAHTKWLFTAAFAPGNKLLFTAGGDGYIRSWDTASGARVGELAAHDDDVHAIGFSKDGKTLYSAGDDMTVRRWTHGDPVASAIVIGEHAEQIPCLAVHPLTGNVVTGSRDETIAWWNPQSGKRIRTLDDHSGDVMSLAFSFDGALLASASYDGTVRVRRGSDGATQAVLRGHLHRVFSVDFGPEAKRLASGGVDGVIVWDLATRLPCFVYKAAQYVSAVRYVRGGEWLLATDAEGFLHVLDASTGRRVRKIATARAHFAVAR